MVSSLVSDETAALRSRGKKIIKSSSDSNFIVHVWTWETGLDFAEVAYGPQVPVKAILEDLRQYFCRVLHMVSVIEADQREKVILGAQLSYQI